MDFSKTLKCLGISFSLAAAMHPPVAAQTPEPPDADEYIQVSKTVLMACSKDGYMHYYDGPIVISKTDLDRQLMKSGDFDIVRHESNLQRTFVNTVARYNASALLDADQVITIDKALRAAAKEEEADSGISSGFLVMSIGLSDEPDTKNCHPSSPYQGPTIK